VVSQRLGHTSAVVTMTVYAHVMPGSQREAANTFAGWSGRRGEHDALKCHRVSRAIPGQISSPLTCGDIMSEARMAA
jgi:hypothetical protein